MSEIKLDTEKHDIDDLIRYLHGDHHMGVHDRWQLVKDIVAQMPKPAVKEPAEFGSVVRASNDGINLRLWTPAPYLGEHYWMAETRMYEVWSELTDVEVLRVGLDGATSESYRKGFEFGLREMNTQAHQKIRALLADAITGERKNAFEKAIQAVEELAP